MELILSTCSAVFTSAPDLETDKPKDVDQDNVVIMFNVSLFLNFTQMEHDNSHSSFSLVSNTSHLNI